MNKKNYFYVKNSVYLRINVFVFEGVCIINANYVLTWNEYCICSQRVYLHLFDIGIGIELNAMRRSWN